MSFFEVVIAVVVGMLIYNAIQNDREEFNELLGGAFKLLMFAVFFIPNVIYLSYLFDIGKQYEKTVEKVTTGIGDYVTFLLIFFFTIVAVPLFVSKHAVYLTNTKDTVKEASLKDYIYGLLYLDVLGIVYWVTANVAGNDDLGIYAVIATVIGATVWRYVYNMKAKNA